MWDKKEIRKRASYIRKNTPDILSECFELQNHICDLCGQEIQCLEVASLDHSIPISYYSRSELFLEEANTLCNSRNNLRAAHARCNIVKNGRPREIWFAKGMDELVGTAKILTEKEIIELRKIQSARSSIGGKIGGRIAVETGQLKRITTFEVRSKGGKVAGPINGRNGDREGKRRCGLKAKQNGTGIWAKDFDRSKGPKIGGSKTASIPGHMSEAGKLGSHIAWHVNRNRRNENCKYCNPIEIKKE